MNSMFYTNIHKKHIYKYGLRGSLLKCSSKVSIERREIPKPKPVTQKTFCDDCVSKRKCNKNISKVKKCIKEADIYQKFHPVIIQEQKGGM